MKIKITLLNLLLLIYCSTTKAQETPKLILPNLDKFDIRGMHFIPGKNLLVSHGSDDNLKIWQVNDGKLLHQVVFNEEYNPNGIAISPDAKTIALVTFGNIYWINTEDFSVTASEFLSEEDGMQQYNYSDCVFSKDGKTLYVGGGHFFELVLWKIPLMGNKPERLCKAAIRPQEIDAPGADPYKGSKSFVLSADGKSIIATAGEKDFFQFNLTDRTCKRITTLEANYATVLPNGQIISSLQSNGKSVIKISSSAFTPLSTLTVNFPVVNIIAYPKTNKCLLVGSSQYAILNADSKTIMGTYSLPVSNVKSMAIDENELNIAYGSVSDYKATLNIRHLDDQKDVLSLGTSLFQTDEVISNKRLDAFIISKSFPGYLKSVKINQGVISVKTLPFTSDIRAGALTDNKVIFTPNGEPVKWYDLKKSDENYKETNWASAVYDMVLSDNGELAASLTKNGLYIYDIARNEQIAHLLHKPEYKEFNEFYSAAFSPDNKYIVACYGAYNRILGVKCWELSGGNVMWHLEQSEYDNFRYTPDGKEIFCIENGKNKRSILWLEASSGKIIRSTPLDMPQRVGLKISIAPDFSTFMEIDQLTLYEIKSGKKIRRYIPNGVSYGASLLPNGYYALICYNSSDPDYNMQSMMVLYDFIQDKELANIYLFDDSDDWVVTTPQGHYDATPGAMERMYYKQGLSLISLEALASQFYYPRLFNKLLNDYKPPTNDDIKRLKKPPVVKIGIPKEHRNLIIDEDKANIPIYTVNSELIKVQVESNAFDDLIQEIRLFHNGKLVETTRRNLVVDDDPGSHTKTVEFELSLLNGENILRAIAINSQLTESAPDEMKVIFKSTTTSNNNSMQIQLHAIVIGINKYKNPKYNLNYATADANAFTEALKSSAAGIFSNITVHQIGDEQASKNGIVEALEKIKNQTTANDVFVFYYAGHGVLDQKNNYYLVPHDVTQLYGNDEGLAQLGLSAALLQQYSKEIKAQKQLFLLDACQSAGALDPMISSRGAAEEKAVAQLARSTGTHWITASGSEQYASEFAQLGHGTFTYVLLDALKGNADSGDKKITVKEINAYLQSLVPEITAKYKGSPQYPSSYEFGNDFPIGIVR